MKIHDLDCPGFECVRHGTDEETGLNAFIAIHDTTLGPALGGLRIWPYGDEDAALRDVLRLAEGMTYKSAIAKTGLGGGKAVIVGDPASVRRPETLRAMGRLIDSLEGRYITAEDVNCRIEDLREVRKTTRFVTGLSRGEGGSGNPGPFTAHGVYLGIRATLEHRLGNPSCKGRHIAVQGAGTVATHLIGALLDDGARVTACDIAEERVAKLRARHPEVAFVAPEAIYDVECDVFAPCALGAVINDTTLPRLRCSIVAGAANNQLATVAHGAMLRENGILYAPDYIINAGGIINVGCELLPGGYDEEAARRHIEEIPLALKSTFELAEEKGIPSAEAALEIARGILEAARATQR